MSENLIHKGSTKDVYQKGTNYLFRFSDRYSVFDWGEMPDLLEGKGASLAEFTKILYGEISGNGIKTHLVSSITRNNEIEVTPFTVIRDGSSIQGLENVFIPLEIIFRMGFAKGSSLRKKKTEAEWKEAGYDRVYSELEMFDVPHIEFTTKLERFDRPLSHIEARELSGLNDNEWNSLLSITKSVALILKNKFEQVGITLWDGKIELAAGQLIGSDREIILVDSIGPDELRLTKNGIQLSKELIRQYYRQTEWYSQLEKVKERHGVNFKEFISSPPVLPKEFKLSVEEMYSILPEILRQSGEIRLQKLMHKLKGYL
jgi:phosphoribosylaminoimidazole-succinocarboxamide synthase